MRDDPPPVDQRQRRGGIHSPVVTLARPEAPWDQPVADPLPARLPAWPFRRPPRASEPVSAESRAADDARTGRPSGEALAHRPAANIAPRSRHFAADRAAARYAPDGAVVLVDDRNLPVMTVSMTGISVRWDAGRLPAVGARIEAEVAPGTAVGEFAAAFEVVRVEPERRLVAGRFGRLSGPAIDRLLTWLSQLDRAAAKA